MTRPALDVDHDELIYGGQRTVSLMSASLYRDQVRVTEVCIDFLVFLFHRVLDPSKAWEELSRTTCTNRNQIKYSIGLTKYV